LYQPIVNLVSRAPIGFEALTRGPKGTFFENPLNLFALATEANMSFELEALCLSLSLARAGFIVPAQMLFLNVDPMVVTAGYFKDRLFQDTSCVKPSQISIEITERTCVKNFTQLAAELEYFKSMGMKVSIDDVGEGYSSLNAVAQLKPQFIKVDINLVRNVDTDAVKKSLIAVLVDLAKKMGSHIIAEGVETEGEYQALGELGVEYGQGYLFAKPSEHPV
jgi:EAL domain-containing protein (putative c-di-GMP-specific phosphodiesterase class I)